MKDNRPFNL